MATSDQSFQLSQPLIYDYIRSAGSDANPSQHESPAVGSRTRSKINATDLPERSANQVSKKQRKANNKRQRKSRRSAQNASRNLSGGSESSSSQNDLSPPPSPDSSRTVSQMLGDAIPTPDNSPDSESSEINRYKNIIDLLNDDLTSATKLLDQFKKSNKRLTSENDKLKRDLSKKSGMRQFTTSETSTQTQSDPPTRLQDTADMSVAKFNSFCDHVSTIAKSLFDDFSKAKISTTPTQAETTVPPSSSPSAGFQPVQSRKRPAPKTASAQSNPIPVIQVNTTRTPLPPTYAQVSSRSTGSRPPQRRPGQGARKRTRTIILGTSLTDGLSSELNKHGISTTTHIYRGAKLDLIRERVPHIFPKDVRKQPDNILLLAGGNDAEETTVDLTINSYEGLVRDIRKVCPQAKIILSAIPPRKNNVTINKRIEKVNEYLSDRGQRNDFVEFVNVVPTESKLFTAKKVHFNSEGKSTFATSLKPFLLD